MASPPNLVQLSFAAGLDESQQDETLDPMTAFPVLQNVRQDKRGGITKRPGTEPLTRARLDATTRSTGNRLISHKDVVCTIDGNSFDAYSESASVFKVASRLPEVGVTTRSLATLSSALYDLAYCNGYVATAALRSLDVIVSLETLDGVVLRPSDHLMTSTVTETVCQLGTYSTYIIALVNDTTTATIKAWYLDTSTAATITTGWVAMTDVATDKSIVAAILALSTQSLTNRVAFAYVNNSAGTSRVTVKTITIAGVSETTTINTSSVTPGGVAIEGSIADTLWVAWNETVSLKIVGLDADSLASTLASTATIITCNTAPTTSPFIVSSSTAGQGKLSVNDGDGLNWQTRGFQTTAGAAATNGSQYSLCGTFMNARPFQASSRFYGLFRGGDSTNGVSVLCDFTDVATYRWLRPVAYTFPGLTGSIGINQLHPFTIGAVVAYAMPVARTAHSSSVALVEYDFADTNRWRWVAHNEGLYLSGGLLAHFDRRRVAECSFLHAPKTPTAVDSGGGSGPSGTYRYVCTYEEIDNDGNWAVSAVSLPSSVLTIVDNTATVATQPLVMSGRLTSNNPDNPGVDERVRVCFYRTLTGAEAPYYFLTSAQNVTTAAISISDSTADATLSSARKLLGHGNLPGTNGAALDRNPPPYCRDVVSYNGMLVVASGSLVWWSGQTVDGEATWFNNEEFFVPIEGDGDITALAVLDGTLFVFKARRIYAFVGEAPSDNGSSGGLGAPRCLQSDVGCIETNSVVSTSLGIFFQSQRGIELLSRDGSVDWIGEKIQRTLASFPVVTSAVLDDRNGLVRISLVEARSASTGRVSGFGRDVIYDTSLKIWQSVDAKYGTSTNEGSQDAAMVIVNGERRYAWLGTDGYVRFEKLSDAADRYLDGSTWITMAAETAWFKVSGIQGTQCLNHVLMLERKATGHDLALSLSYNYETTFRTARTWLRAEIDALLDSGAGWPITQLKHEPHDDSECQGFRIRVVDATPTDPDPEELIGTGQGATWIALTLDVTPRPGIFDVPEEAA